MTEYITRKPMNIIEAVQLSGWKRKQRESKKNCWLLTDGRNNVHVHLFITEDGKRHLLVEQYDDSDVSHLVDSIDLVSEYEDEFDQIIG